MNVGNKNINVHLYPASSYLGNSDFSLSLFGENSETSPVFHVRKLEEFMRLRCIPKAHQLAISYKLVTGN
jgi:hypothetical protein